MGFGSEGRHMPKVKIDGHHWYYEEYGQGPTLVFLHGLGACLQDWYAQKEALCLEYRVVLVDLKGHGLSDKPHEEYTIVKFAQEVQLLLEALNITTYTLVGWSMGGMIAMQMALNAPQKIKQLIVVNSGPNAQAHNLKLKLMVWGRNCLLSHFSMSWVAKMVAWNLFPEGHQGHLRHALIERFKANDPIVYDRCWQALFNWDVSDRLDSIMCPTLVVTADNDYTDIEHKRRYCRQLKQGVFKVISNSRHGTPIDQPEQLNQAIIHFLPSKAG